MDRSWNARRQTSDNVVEASPNNAAEDPFILDFGTSINVNEDLRRVIKTEIQEIDESIVAGRGALKNEETVEAQLKNDLSHSHREMANLSRGTSEQLETCGVHQNCLSSLNKTIHAELVVPTTPSAVLNDHSRPSSGHDDESPSEVPARTSGNRKTGSQSNREVLRSMSERLKKVTSSMKGTAQEIDGLVEQQKYVSEKTAMIDKSMEADSLPSLLEEKRKEVATMQAELDKENQRRKAIKAATQKSRANSGMHAQAVADKTKELDCLQRDNAAAEAKSSDEVSAAHAQLVEHQKRKAKKDAECTETISQLAYCKEIKEEISEFKKAHSIKLQASENALAESERLIKIKAELEAKLEAAKNELEKAGIELDAAKKVAQCADDMKAANDELETSVILPGKNEIVRLVKEKEQLAMIISNGHEESAAAQEREKEQAKSKADELKAAKAELDTVSKLFEGKKVKKEHFDRVQQESRDNWEREIAEHIAVEEKYRLAYEAESRHREDSYQAKKQEFEGKLEELKSESELRCAAADRHLHILLCGTEIIQHGEEAIRKLNEDPITL